MAVTINIPSQVKTYANLAAFPVSGSLKTIYIAEDTNKTYRWTGSVYVEISASAAMTWGQIGGTLSNQTDLQNALDAKVPTARTLTINGVTQDLSADRTFTIATGLTVGTTPISSGTNGRVLFQGTGNVLQQSSSLFWDSTNNRLGIGTSTPDTNKFLDILYNVATVGGAGVGIRNSNSTGYTELVFDNNTTPTGFGAFVFGYGGTGSGLPDTAYFFQRRNAPLIFGTNGSTRMQIHGNGNIGINTTTDAGFRLDVNGTARVQTSLAVTTGKTFSPYTSNAANDALKLEVSNLSAVFGVQNSNASGFSGIEYLSNAGVPRVFTGFNNGNGQEFRFNNVASGGYIDFLIGSTSGLRIANTRNILINTTTDAGFKLDVNGTARVSGVFSVGSDTARIDLWRSSGAFGGRIGTGYSNPAVNHVYIQCDTNSKAILIDDSNRTLFSSSNGDTTTASAQVTINSSTRGFLPPRMTTTQRNAIASPAAGLVVYDNTDNKHYGYNGTTWNAFY